MTHFPVKLLSPASLRLVRFFCAAALCISAYMLYGFFTGDRLAGCGPESGCDAVLRSRWAYIFGLPVSLPALLLYAAVLGATFLPDSKVAAGSAEGFLICGAAAFIGAALYFVALQVFVIGAICKFCMAAHACGCTAGAMILKAALALRPLETQDAPGMTRKPRPSLFVLAGLLLVGLMAIGQAIHKPKNFAVQSAPGLAERKAPRMVALHDGLFQIDLSDTPLHGSPGASNIIVHLFDYTCPHCRELHPILKTARENLSNQVAVAALLVPLSTNCNRFVQKVIERHRTACDLAYAGLAVWRVNRDKLPAFEDWIFSLTQPPSPASARAKGRELVGTNAFDNSLADPWIPRHLSRNIDLYATNYYRFRKGVLPELMVGTNIVSGSVRGLPDLYKILSEQFHLQIPQ